MGVVVDLMELHTVVSFGSYLSVAMSPILLKLRIRPMHK